MLSSSRLILSNGAAGASGMYQNRGDREERRAPRPITSESNSFFGTAVGGTTPDLHLKAMHARMSRQCGRCDRKNGLFSLSSALRRHGSYGCLLRLDLIRPSAQPPPPPNEVVRALAPLFL